MPPVLKALLFGNFAIGCGVSGLAATLPEISSSLGVSVARAGGLITASSLIATPCSGYCLSDVRHSVCPLTSQSTKVPPLPQRT